MLQLLLAPLVPVVLGLGALAPTAPAQDVPRNDGYVTDLGELLSSGQEAELEELMQDQSVLIRRSHPTLHRPF